jgi:hypothetical protein
VVFVIVASSSTPGIGVGERRHGLGMDETMSLILFYRNLPATTCSD